MTRILTPARICLLALIEIYTEAQVPTLAIIPVLSFLVSHILPSTSASPLITQRTRKNDQHNFLITIQQFEELLVGYPSASGVPGRSLWYLFLKKLWGIDSLDALHVFFDHKSHLLVKSREQLHNDAKMGIPPPSPGMILLSRNSPLGAFIRRSKLEFFRLKFHYVVNLWKGFVAYRQLTLASWKKRNPEVDHWSFDVVLSDGCEEWEHHTLETFSTVAYGNLINQPENADGLASTEDVEKLLEFQIEQMQKMGNMMPYNVQKQFERMLESNILIPSLSHYVSFLEAWRAGDYPTSFDNLHRFFDYTMHNRDRSFYQYALLNLAVLEADFGSYHEAVTAMQETVSVARENKDMGCLNFSLSWLYHFGKAHPKIINETDRTNMLGVEREGLVFLRTKAKEVGMWHLWSAALLTEAKAGLADGESVATAFENILRSSGLSVSKNMMNNVGAQMMLQSSLWSRLGVTSLAASYLEVFLRCHAKTAPLDDVLKFTCRSAYLLAEKGKYDQALKRLETLNNKSIRPLKANQYWLIFRRILMLKRYLHRNNLDRADHHLRQLLQYRGGDSDITFELNRLHIDSMMRGGDYQGALTKIENLAADYKVDGEDLYFRVKLLIMKALLFDKCGRPQKGFSIAVRAAAIAWRARLLSALWQAMAAIANILTSLEEFEASSQILASIIPRALECEDYALNAQLYSFLADAHMGIAGMAERDSLKRNENLIMALDFIDRAFAEYSSIEDIKGQCEMMAKKATIMRLVGDNVLANDCAAAYLTLKREASGLLHRK